jgi:hypothetical protein
VIDALLLPPGVLGVLLDLTFTLIFGVPGIVDCVGNNCHTPRGAGGGGDAARVRINKPWMFVVEEWGSLVQRVGGGRRLGPALVACRSPET